MTRDSDRGSPAHESARVDVWLWHARVLSTRSACTRLVTDIGIRINGQPTNKAGARLRIGDVLTFAVSQRVRVLRVNGFAARRGSPEAARLIFIELTGPQR